MRAALEFIGPHIGGILVGKIFLSFLFAYFLLLTNLTISQLLLSIQYGQYILLQSKFNEEITVEKVKQLLAGLNYTEVIDIVQSR